MAEKIVAPLSAPPPRLRFSCAGGTSPNGENPTKRRKRLKLYTAVMVLGGYVAVYLVELIRRAAEKGTLRLHRAGAV